MVFSKKEKECVVMVSCETYSKWTEMIREGPKLLM